MSKAVLISIQPKWCKLIADGEKTIEVRKTKPKLETPFKCYIYCTKGKILGDLLSDGKVKASVKRFRKDGDVCLSGKVIGEFVCDKVETYIYNGHLCVYEANVETLKKMQLYWIDLYGYGKGKTLYGWHISDLKIYDKPKELREFKRTRPPQSWCYVEDRNEKA